MKMKQVFIYIIALLILLMVSLISLFLYQRFAAPPSSPTPPQADLQLDEKLQIEQAIRQAIKEQQEGALALLVYDTKIEDVQISSEDSNYATAWLIPVDRETGNVVPAEPGLAIIVKEVGVWTAYLPSDPRWVRIVGEVPNDLISEEEKSAWSQVADLRPSAAPRATYSGYYLPWAGGETMYLTQSVGHDRYTPSGSAHYAFDFAKPGYPSGMFNVLAAKAGTVKQAVWRHPNGDPSNSNYLVLEDTNTSPTTYQLYLHLAQSSIPNELRSIGTHVAQGQFIGIADDTGISSGNHLHFHVHTYPYSYWGTSVDIRFMDVSINGGRPRIRSDLAYCRSSDVCDTTQTGYVSGNFMNPDFTPPEGGIYTPEQSTTISSRIVELSGWASDENSGISGAQFIAKYNGGWHPVGDEFSSNTFTTDWDMCADQVPDGPVSLALELEDKAGNQPQGLTSLRHFTKNYPCPVPPSACAPDSNEVALYAETDYQGACVVLASGIFGTPAYLGNLGDDNAVSIQVGSNLQATFFMKSGLQGRGETFLNNDSNLADNRIGEKTVSSVWVQSRGSAPMPPTLIWPAANAVFDTDASFSLSWYEAGGGTQYQVRLSKNGSELLTTPWQFATYWNLNALLPPASYTWQIKSRNGAVESSWSATRAFEITSNSLSLPTSVTPPFTDTMESMATNWSHSNEWELTDEANHTEDGSISWKYETSSGNGYDTGAPNSGYLTSPPINIPATGEQYLRFWYQYETESPGTRWDQRRVQISADGGEFTDVLQLSDDAPNFWLRSPAISLASYAGQTIRARFYFATLDDVFNTYRGWFIDDLSITAYAPPDCADSNNSFPQATPISYGSSTNGVICPPGDLDFYRFQGIAGDQLGAWTEAQVNGSPLDTYLFMLDVDGHSVLAENDDQVLYQRSDSAINYRIERTGTYFLKVRSWDSPTSGGEDYTYILNLVNDHGDPSASFINPLDAGSVAHDWIILEVSAQDEQSGISHVQFLGHSNDWVGSDWVLIGEDWNGTDGWNYPFNAKYVSDLKGIAFYAFVYDWAGNSIGTGAWNLKPPTVYLPLILK